MSSQKLYLISILLLIAACSSLSVLLLKKEKAPLDNYKYYLEMYCEHAAVINSSYIETIFNKELARNSSAESDFVLIIPPYPCMACLKKQFDMAIDMGVFDSLKTTVITPNYLFNDIRAWSQGLFSNNIVTYDSFSEGYDCEGYDGVIFCTKNSGGIKDVFLSNKTTDYPLSIFLGEAITK